MSSCGGTEGALTVATMSLASSSSSSSSVYGSHAQTQGGTTPVAPLLQPEQEEILQATAEAYVNFEVTVRKAATAQARFCLKYAEMTRMLATVTTCPPQRVTVGINSLLADACVIQRNKQQPMTDEEKEEYKSSVLKQLISPYQHSKILWCTVDCCSYWDTVLPEFDKIQSLRWDHFNMMARTIRRKYLLDGKQSGKVLGMCEKAVSILRTQCGTVKVFTQELENAFGLPPKCQSLDARPPESLHRSPMRHASEISVPD
jgi:hypothetical protein